MNDSYYYTVQEGGGAEDLGKIPTFQCKKAFFSLIFRARKFWAHPPWEFLNMPLLYRVTIC